MTSPPRFMTRREAADFLRISERSIDRLARAGRLPTCQIGGTRSIRFDSADLIALARDPRRA